MQNNYTDRTITGKLRLLFAVVLFEYLLFIYSGVSFSFLHGNSFFDIGADPAVWIFYLLKIPQFIVEHYWLGILLDITVVILLLAFIFNPYRSRTALASFVLLLLFYVTLTGYLTHHNYQAGFFLIFIPFLFKKGINKRYSFEIVRYFILFFYVSAALLKLSGHALTGEQDFSHLISGQFTPYYLEGNTGFRTGINLYLVNNPAVAHTLYLISIVVELIPFVGFFTKRFDKWIGVLLLSFHFGNWLIMDIAPFGQIAFLCLLFMSRELGLKDESPATP